MADPLPENTQRTLLQNAVIGLNALQEVQINLDLQKATHGTALMSTWYCTLLINSATGDAKLSDKPNYNGKPRPLVFNLETLLEDNDETFKFDYDVDTMTGKLQAYAINCWECPQFKSGSLMPIARWQALSEQAKQIWDSMTDDDKALILALQEKREKSTHGSQISPSSPSTRTPLPWHQILHLITIWCSFTFHGHQAFKPVNTTKQPS
jgi:hypothetical protein